MIRYPSFLIVFVKGEINKDKYIAFNCSMKSFGQKECLLAINIAIKKVLTSKIISQIKNFTFEKCFLAIITLLQYPLKVLSIG